MMMDYVGGNITCKASQNMWYIEKQITKPNLSQVGNFKVVTFLQFFVPLKTT